MLHKRPHNRFEELAGVYLVGGGTHPGSGLPVIYSSARITSKLLLKDLGVFQPENRSIDRKEWTQAPSTREASMACSTGLFQNSQLNPQE